MNKIQLIVGILAQAAIIIIGMAVFIITHFSSMSSGIELILIGVSVVVLFIIMGALFMIVRYTANK